MTNNRQPDLNQVVRQLTERFQSREFYVRKSKPRYHTTSNQPLIIQLLRASSPSLARNESSGRAGSKPSANITAIDLAVEIHTVARQRLFALEADFTGSTTDLVRRLASLIPSQYHCGLRHPKRDEQHQVICCQAHQIEADLRSWWIRSRLVTGWDLPPWRPDNTCPLCGHRGTLRIHSVEKIATCTHCAQTWDQATIGLLADHIRTENGER